MKVSLTLRRKLLLLHLTMVVAGVGAFGYIANEIVSGAIQTQHTRFLAIRQKDAKIRANETVEMLNRGLSSELEDLRRAVVTAVVAGSYAEAASSLGEPGELERVARRMALSMRTLHLDIFTLVGPDGRVMLRGSDPKSRGDTAYRWRGEGPPRPTADVWQLVERALAGQSLASIEALPASILATERYVRETWVYPPHHRRQDGHFASLADFVRIELLLSHGGFAPPEPANEERGLALATVTPVRERTGRVCAAVVACRLLSRSPEVLAESIGVRGDIGALYLGRGRVAVAADASGLAKPIGSVLSQPVADALLASRVTQAGVEALASLGELAAYRVLLDGQKRPIGVVYARTPTSQFGIELETERVSERLAQANSKKIIWMTAATAGLLSLAITIVYLEFVSKPLRELVQLSQSLAAGDLNVRAPEKGSDEVSLLARSMNQMATALEKSYRELEGKVIERTRSLEQSQARYRNLIESAPDMIHTLDEEGRILSVNAREVETLGYTRKELEEMSLRDIIAQRLWQATDKALARAFQSPYPQRYETVLVTQDGREISAEVTTTMRREDNRAIQTNIIRDVTEQKRLQRQLIESERLSAVGEMIIGVAHEIGNPLNTLGITVRNLQDDIARSNPPQELREEYDGSLDILVSELDRLDRLIDDFMKVARIPLVMVEDCDLQALINDLVKVVSPQADELGVEIAAHLPDGLSHIPADTELLRQAFLNLVLNSIEAVKPGGKVAIRVAQNEAETVVSFADNGCGVPDEHRDRVFDIFYSSKERGAGIGLSLVHRIARAHRSSVTFDTEVGQGSTFYFVLPRKQALVAADARNV